MKDSLTIKSTEGFLVLDDKYLNFDGYRIRIDNISFNINFTCQLKKSNVTIRVSYINNKLQEQINHNGFYHRHLENNCSTQDVLGLLLKYKNEGFNNY